MITEMMYKIKKWFKEAEERRQLRYIEDTERMKQEQEKAKIKLEYYKQKDKLDKIKNQTNKIKYKKPQQGKDNNKIPSLFGDMKPPKEPPKLF